MKALTGNIKNTVCKLLKWIEKNNLSVNDKIPSMAELSKTFNSSVNSIHLAVKFLVEQGILKANVGSGTYVNRLVKESELEFGDEPVLPVARHKNIALVMNSRIADLFKSDIDSIENVDYWYFSTLKGLCSAGKREGVSLVPVSIPYKYYLRPSPEKIKEMIDTQTKDCDVIITFPMYNITEVFKYSRIPVVYINQPDSTVTNNYVAPDYYGVSRKVGELASRIKRISNVWIFVRSLSWPSDLLRTKGLREGLLFSDRKLEIEKIINVINVDYDSAFKAVKKAVNENASWPDFIYASGGQMAKAAADYAKSCGIKLGKDLMLISSSNLKELETYDPPVTSTVFPMEEVGRVALDMACRMLDSGQYTFPPQILPTPLVIRKTTPPEAKNILHDIEEANIKIHCGNYA